MVITMMIAVVVAFTVYLLLTQLASYTASVWVCYGVLLCGSKTQ